MTRQTFGPGVLLVPGLALQIACGASSADAPGVSVPESGPPDPIAVASVPVAAREVPVVIRATGTFVADEAADVAPAVAGLVRETLVDVGDIVRAGAPLVRLDDRDARLRLRQAQASLQQVSAEAAHAAAEAERNARLAESGDISRSVYERLRTARETAEAAVAVASAQVASAEKGVADVVIEAPFGGHVSRRPVAAGEHVTPGSPVVTLVRIRPLRLELRIPATEAARVSVGVDVRATVPGFGTETFAGSITAISPAVDPDSRALSVEVTFPNADGRLRPGMFATADVQLPAMERALFVPRAAVVAAPGGESSSAVYVVEAGAAALRVVQLSVAEGDEVRVRAGIEPGEQVIISPLDQLFAGAAVSAGPGVAAAADTPQQEPSRAEAR
ncbi:MAG: efflux RND transporter periplasmic adaptor subunit [Acidimicrobiia bacterium]|nr:efflux RND transporter periplasmic adaptor subunit [Acidimicrobiia bacterium]